MGRQGTMETVLTFDSNELLRDLLGPHHCHLHALEKLEAIKTALRGSSIHLTGERNAVLLVRNILSQLYEIIEKGYPLYLADIGYAHRILSQNANARIADIFMDKVFIAAKKKIIAPKSLAQKEYIEAMRKSDMVFSIGPAGTGKTYLAMAMAISSLLNKEVARIILARPAVEAGEKLGFLPGDLAEKVNPYLRPLYDALYDMLDYERAQALLQKGTIEVAPLAFMRGRTLNEAFVILDEAQNTTSEQMKMFLTRLGFGSKAVINGDITQVDLPSERVSGLVEAQRILKNTRGVCFVEFTDVDVVRHPLVQEIIKAYAKNKSGNAKASNAKASNGKASNGKKEAAE